MIILLTQKDDVEFVITKEWLNVTDSLRYIGKPDEIIINPTVCGLIVDYYKDGYMDYSNKSRVLKPIESFKTLLLSHGIKTDDYKNYQIFKIIL